MNTDGSLYDWEPVYGEHDGYKLFQALRYGQTTYVEEKGVTYRLKFGGPHVGRGSWLEVVGTDGESRRYEPGYDLSSVFAALEELVAGWQVPQQFLPRKRPVSDSKVLYV